MHYAWWAERYGWTPEQVDNLPWLMRERLIAVAAIRDEIAEQKKAQG